MRRAVVAILIVLILIALFFIGRHIPFGAGNSIFHVENTDRITHIVISEENISVRLQRRNELRHDRLCRTA